MVRHVRLTRRKGPWVPARYVPAQLTRKDREAQKRALRRSRKLYQKGVYWERPRLASFRSRPSRHVRRAYQLYGVDTMAPGPVLARRSGCPVRSLRAIVRKGEGAYYASGSRPNQTARSWGYARLASALTGGPASRVDRHILAAQCDPRKPAYRLSQPA
jgi:hypothetical protein